jgi:hypothetical protein
MTLFYLQSVLFSTHVGWGCVEHAFSYDDLTCRGQPECSEIVASLPYILAIPIWTSLILLCYLLVAIVDAVMMCLVCCKCIRRDHENGIVLVPVVYVDAEAHYVGEIGEIPEVNANADDHYVVDVLEVIADVDYSLQSSFVRPAVVANEACNV